MDLLLAVWWMEIFNFDYIQYLTAFLFKSAQIVDFVFLTGLKKRLQTTEIKTLLTFFQAVTLRILHTEIILRSMKPTEKSIRQQILRRLKINRLPNCRTLQTAEDIQKKPTVSQRLGSLKYFYPGWGREYSTEKDVADKKRVKCCNVEMWIHIYFYVD